MDNTSRFQFQRPVLVSFSFGINDEYISSDNHTAMMQIGLAVNINKSDNSPDADVEIIIKIGEKSSKVPFWLEAKEGGNFKWEESLDDETVEKLLNQNAPALLLSYLRPLISAVNSLR